MRNPAPRGLALMVATTTANDEVEVRAGDDPRSRRGEARPSTMSARVASSEVALMTCAPLMREVCSGCVCMMARPPPKESSVLVKRLPVR